jgi:hypothetical protein
MIEFACGLMVTTCSWFGFNAIIVTHLFEHTFEFAPIFKDNKLMSRVGNVSIRCYETNPGSMLLIYLWLRQSQTNLCLIAGSIIASENRDCVLAGVLIVKGMVQPDPHIP